MNNYYFIELDIQDEELLSALEHEAFKNFNCAGTQDFTLDEAEVDRILGERSYSGGDLPVEILEEVEQILKDEGKTKKTLYFETPEDVQLFNDFLKGWNLSGLAKTQEREVSDWNEKWKSNFKTIIVNDELSIVPSWEKEKDEENKIFIYPGMGFGTGNHETTFLCLQLMLENIEDLQELKTCLDFGCGSGILGIGAAQKAHSISDIDYLDIDQNALNNCNLNLELNTKANRVNNQLLLSDEVNKLKDSYDLVFANILKHTLLEEAAVIVNKTKKYLIVSGLLKGQEVEVCQSYEAMDPKLKVKKILFKNDWSAVLFERS
ncbi:MAG: 50S ribosomal protein L11 methyltransferase [Bacteriovoracaceae bacterium]|nr:50S ribosomal protein L11 methyltransferase [Bacteriovoracaceae bacterium]